MIVAFNHVYKKFLSKAYSLKNIHFQLDQGDILFISGSSGAGKTTLLKLMYMEMLPSNGEVVISLDKKLGYRSSKMSFAKVQELRRNIGIIFQDFKLFSNRTVFENVAFPLQIQGKKKDEIQKDVYALLSEYKMTHKAKSYPFELSGGEQQRVAIMRAIINKPKLIIADEPTGNLDEKNSLEIMKIIKKLNAQGTTIVISTHEVDLMEHLYCKKLTLFQGSARAT